MKAQSVIAAVAGTMGWTSGIVLATLPIFAGSDIDPATGVGVQAMSGQLGGPWINEQGIAVGNGGTTPAGSSWAVVRWGPDLPWQQLDSVGTNASGARFPKATAIGETGTVVGTASHFTDAHTSLGSRAARWDLGTTAVTELLMSSDPGAFQSGTAHGIDAVGNVAGTVGVTAGFPMRWSAGSTQGAYLPTLGAPTTGPGTGSAGMVAASGVIAGAATKYVNSSSIGSRVVWWDADGNVNELPQIGAGSAKLRAINAHGALVGFTGSQAVYVAPGSTTYLTLRPLAAGVAGASSSPNAVGNQDAIVGTSYKYLNGAFQYAAPVAWATPLSDPIELAVDRPAGVAVTVNPTAINSSGIIAGTVTVSGGTSSSYPLLWRLDGTSIDFRGLVGEPGWTLRSVNDLSDTGWVVGEAIFDPDGTDGPVVGYRRFYSLLLPAAGTYGRGDANFDTSIDFDDLLILAQHYDGSSSGRVDVADLDLDGTTDFDDLLTLAQNYSGTDFRSDWALAQSMVPEPAFITCALLFTFARRKRG